MTLPFIDLKSPLVPIMDAVLEDWRTCLGNASFVGGPFVKQFEADFVAKTAAQHFISCANGTDALTLALAALGLGAGHNIALPDVTFWATYEAVRHVGANAILLDIDPADLQLSYSDLVKAHEQHTLHAVLLPHLYGWCSARLQQIRAYCHANNIALVEDSAQAFGVQYNQSAVISTAEIATMSFYPAKVIGGCMDGGGICTNSATVADKLRRLGNHGRSAHYEYSEVGYNSRMGDLQASFLSRVLSISDALLESRLQALQWYQALHAKLEDPRVTLHMPPANCRGNGYLMVLTVADVDIEVLAGRMREHHIGVARTYPVPISVQPPVLQDISTGYAVAFANPHSARFCQQVINLPLFAGITHAQVVEAWDTFVTILQATE